MESLREYQREAVEKIYNFFMSKEFKAKIYISAGLGKTIIIVSALEKILSVKSSAIIAVLTTRRAKCDNLKAAFPNGNDNITVTTYNDMMNHRSVMRRFDLIVCDDAEFVNELDVLSEFGDRFIAVMQNHESPESWYYNAVSLFSYTMKDAIKDGYSIYGNEHQFIEHFLINLLYYQEFVNVGQEVSLSSDKELRADVVAEKDGEYYVIEVKTYRNLHNTKTVLNSALRRFMHYKELLSQNINKEVNKFIIVMPCEIDDALQKEIFEKHNIDIWDINNLMYLCGGSKELTDMLLSNVPFPALDLEAKKPLGIKSGKIEVVLDDTETSLPEVYIKKLEECKPGKIDKADKEYETICTEIITYLFETEFFRISKQHKTDDKMFRMDLLCSLKGTTEFWKFLMMFYQTKFVVFEYKNYSGYIDQNLIYITEKYLFPVALRNVAFIISRKGFDANAQKAALGCLRENGKLIISLNDDDLIKMLVMEKNGEEPSDYLMEIVEELLMSVSK